MMQEQSGRAADQIRSGAGVWGGGTAGTPLV